MRKKQTMSLLMGLMLIMSASMIMAQDPIEDVVVTAGETGTSDFDVSETVDHDTIGGLISAISHETIKTVDFLGTTVFQTSEMNGEDVFTMYATPDISQINYDNLIRGDVFEVSESNIEIRNVVGTWTTYLFDSTTTDIDPAGDFVIGMNEGITADNAEYIEILSEGGGDGRTITLRVLPDSTIALTLVYLDESTGECGSLTAEEIRTEAGVTGDVLCNTHNGVLIAEVQNSETPKFIVDANVDGIFDDFTESGSETTVGGFSWDASSGQALGLLESGTYDIFAII